MFRSRPVIGLLGGISSGKSTVARRLASLGPGRVVDADSLAHDALAAAAADGRLEAALGPGFVREDGKPDRAALGASVFSDTAPLRRLERLIHPTVQVAIKAAIEDHLRGEGPAVLILDVPLLIEVGLDRACTELWFIEVPDELRKERAGGRGMTAEQIAQRERFQSPLVRKRARADRILVNAGTPADLDEQIRRALADLGAGPAPLSPVGPAKHADPAA